MAVPTFVNSTSASSGSAGTTLAVAACAAGDTVAIGDLLVLATLLGAASTISSVVDSKGNTWTRSSTVGSSPKVETWYCVPTVAMTSSDTVTLTFPLTTNKGAMVAHFKSASGSPFDQAASLEAFPPSSAMSSPASAATTQAEELVIGVFGCDSGPPPGVASTPGSGFTTIRSLLFFSNELQLYMEYKTVTATGAQTATATGPGNLNWYAATVLTFKGAVAGPTASLVGYFTGIGPNSGSQLQTFTATVPAGGVAAGHKLVVGVAGASGDAGETVTDTRGNTYTRRRVQAEGSNYFANLSVFDSDIAVALQPGDVVTYACGGTFTVAADLLICVEFSGAGVASFDQVAGGPYNNPGTTLTTPATGVLAQAGELVVGIFMDYNTTGSPAVAVNFSAGSGYTAVGSVKGPAGGALPNVGGLFAEYKNVSATTAVNASATADSSPWSAAGVVITYKNLAAVVNSRTLSDTGLSFSDSVARKLTRVRALADTGLIFSDALLVTPPYPIYSTAQFVQWLGQRGTRCGPWLIGGALYVMGLDANFGVLRMYKSTDGGRTWAEMDAAHRPTVNSSSDTFLSGSTIWIEYLDASNTFRLQPFSGDLWGTPSSAGPTLGSRSNSGGRYSCIAGVRSNGDVVLVHQATQETVASVLRDRVGVTVYSGGSWLTTQVIGTGVAAHFDHVASALGASDRIHLFYTRTDQPNSLQHRSLSPTNVLDTEVAAATNLINVTDGMVCGLAVGFVNGANTEIVVPYKTSGNIVGVVRFFSQANPSSFTRTNVSSFQPDSTFASTAAVVNGTTVTVFFCDNTSKDIYRNSDSGTNTWGADTLTAAATANNGLTAQPVSSTQAGLVWSDQQTNTVVFYVPVKTVLVTTVNRTALDTGLSFSDTLARTASRAQALGDSGLVFSDSLVRATIKSFPLTDTGLVVSDGVRKQPRPRDTGLTITDSLTRSMQVSFYPQDAGMAFFDAGISTAKPKAMTDTGLAMTTILWCAPVRLMEDTGWAGTPDTVQAATQSLGLYSFSISGFGMTPGATDTLRLAKSIIRVTDTGLTVSDLFKAVGVTQPVRGSRRWMAGRSGGSDMTG